MISDEERREVARRLRKTRVERYNSILSGIHLGESARVCAQIVSPHEDQVRAAADRLADLIEPSEPEGTCGNCKHFTKDRFMPCDAAHGYTEADVSACEDFSPLSCDRDALLALADEMERMPQCELCPAEIVDCSAHPDGCPDALLDHYARRIREALGVES